jgi:anti-sigma-K factor RskA
MSDHQGSEGQDRDLLAAEYVLGVLEGDQAAAAKELMVSDSTFVRQVESWQQRLAPLAATAAPLPPPADLWSRIDVSTGGAATAGPGVVVDLAAKRRVRFWQGATAVSLAAAASIAAFAVLRPPEAPRVAVLAPVTGTAPVLVAVAEADNRLIVQPNGTISVPADKDLELWALEAGATQPRSLGVLPAGGRRLTAALPAGTQLLVSLEPRGGSPTGQPTGPVLYGGRLAGS